MKGWLFLVIAIVGEVIATSALKSSEGFTKLAPSAVVITLQAMLSCPHTQSTCFLVCATGAIHK